MFIENRSHSLHTTSERFHFACDGLHRDDTERFGEGKQRNLEKRQI